VNATDSLGRAPLLLAAGYGHFRTAKLLIDMDADVNARGREYGNALYAALFRGHKQVVKLLLKKNVNVNT
ncbi:ankyrin, partial [Lentithecium fluviatile CBS 122367]